MTRGRRGGLALALVLAAAACDDRDGATTTRVPDQPPRRVIEPPRRDVRALPPHVIAAGGVGPYKLGVAMERVLSALPSGPRLTVLQIPGVLDVRIGRDDGLIVGGERQGPSSFVAVLREGFARTADGIGVGARRDAVVAALGPMVDDARVARDPALWVGSRLGSARFVFDGERVVAVLLAHEPAATTGEPAPRCALPASPVYDGVAGGPGGFRPACLGAADGFAIVGEQVVTAASAQGDRSARRVASTQVSGLRWAAPVRGDGERDDLIVVSEQVRERQRVLTVVALRPDGSRLVPVASLEAYRLTDPGLSLIGATLADVALALEVSGDGDVLTVGGAFIHRAGGAVSVVAPLVPVTVRRTRRVVEERVERPEVREPGRDGRVSDGGVRPRDAGADAPTDANDP